MDLIKLERINDCDVVDSRLIAIELGIQHKNFISTINKYESEIKECFGALAFQTEGLQGTKDYAEYYYLNEEQATYIMTLSKNTEKVRLCKRKLVKSFYQAKQLLQQQPIQQPVERVLPTRDAVDYIEAGYKLQAVKDGMLKQLSSEELRGIDLTDKIVFLDKDRVLRDQPLLYTALLLVKI